MEKSAESVDSLDPRRVVESPPRDIGDGHLEIDPTMRSRCVVVLDELFEDALEMTLVSDEKPVEALGPCGADEPFGERVGTRRADRGLDHSGTNRRQHFIEGPDELGISISDQELDDPAFVLECHCEIARLLGDPAPDRMRGDTGEEDLASFEIEEKQDIEPAKRDGVGGEEVACKCAASLSSKQLWPRRSRSPWCWFETVTSKNIANARRRDGDTELGALADDTEIAPPGVLTGEAKHECHNVGIERVVRRSIAARKGPVPAKELMLAAQQSRWRDEEGSPTLTRKQPCKCREHRAIGRGEPRSCHLALEHRELMTQHRDLDILLIWGRTDANEVEQASNEKEGHRTAHTGDRGTFTASLVRG